MTYADNDIFYLYGMKRRGYSPGAQPKYVFQRRDDPTGKYFDILVYRGKHELSDYAMMHYDLEFIGTETYKEVKEYESTNN